MDELNAAVEAILRGQKDPDEAVRLWERIWAEYQGGGTEGVAAFLAGLLEHPEAA